MTRWPLTHGCGAVITEEQWKTLPDCKHWHLDDGVVLEQRLCPGGCGSHITIQIAGPDFGDGDVEDDAA